MKLCFVGESPYSEGIPSLRRIFDRELGQILIVLGAILIANVAARYAKETPWFIRIAASVCASGANLIERCTPACWLLPGDIKVRHRHAEGSIPFRCMNFSGGNSRLSNGSIILGIRWKKTLWRNQFDGFERECKPKILLIPQGIGQIGE